MASRFVKMLQQAGGESITRISSRLKGFAKENNPTANLAKERLRSLLESDKKLHSHQSLCKETRAQQDEKAQNKPIELAHSEPKKEYYPQIHMEKIEQIKSDQSLCKETRAQQDKKAQNKPIELARPEPDKQEAITLLTTEMNRAENQDDYTNRYTINQAKLMIQTGLSSACLRSFTKTKSMKEIKTAQDLRDVFQSINWARRDYKTVQQLTKVFSVPQSVLGIAGNKKSEAIVTWLMQRIS